MNATKAFICIQLKNSFSISSFFEDFKGGPSKIRKNIGIIAGLMYLVVFSCFLFGFQQYTLYKVLKPEGLEMLLLANTAIVATFFPFFLGFINAISTYVTNATEETLLSLPVPSIALLASKWISSFVLQLPLVALLTATGAGVYGYLEGILFSPLFLLGIITGIFVLPLFPFCLIYVLLVLVFSFGKGITRKKLLSGISSTIMILVLIASNWYMQNSIQYMQNTSYITDVIKSGGFSAVKEIVTRYMPAVWFMLALSGKISAGKILLNLLLLAVTGIAATVILLFLLAPAYRKSIVGFYETKTVKMKSQKASSFIKKDIKSTPILRALLKRDMLNVLREPAFFFNGPFVIIIIPVILSISLFISFRKSDGADMTKLIDLLNSEKISASQIIFLLTGIAALGGMFLGSLTSLGATAFSREGKMIQNIKAMPLSVKTIATAKLLHAMFYAAISTLLMETGAILLIIFSGRTFSPLQLCETFFFITVISLTGAFLLQVVDMFIDTAHPKLDWEIPAVVFKQNINSGLGVFIPMGITAILVCAIIFMPHIMWPYAIIFAVLATTGISIWIRYLKYAEKKYPDM